MTSSPNWRSVGDEYRQRMTSVPVPVESAHAQSSLLSLCPIQREVYCCGEDGQRQIVLVVTVPAPQHGGTGERATTPPQRPVDMSTSQIAEDLTTRPSRCSNSELHTNEQLSRERSFADDDKTLNRLTVATPQFSTRNPVFGKSKSPKSYWLRRHSDSVFADADRDLALRDDDALSSTESIVRHSKERTVSDSHSAVKEFDVGGSALLDHHKPLTRRFQSAVVGMQFSGESDEVFDEPSAVQSTHPREDVDTGLQHTEEPTATYTQLEQSSLLSRRSRLTVVSTGDLDNIDEENQSSGLNEHEDDDDGDVADSSTFAKLNVDDVGDQPLSDSVRSMELSGSSSLQYSDDATRGDDKNRKLINGERELVRPEAANARPAIRHRTSRVARSSRLSTSAESGSSRDATSSGGKVHRCAVCRRTFARSDMLERHARLHTGVRPYACRLCTQVFSRSDHLTTHLRTHTGEKPYACPRCAYTASRRDMVTRHLRVHQSTPAVDPAVQVSAMVGPPRRRIYRSRYKERATRRLGVDDSAAAPSPISPLEPQPALMDETTLYVRSGVDGPHLSGAAWPGVQRRDAVAIPLPSPSPPASEIACRRRLERIQALHALSRSVVDRGSTGSTDSYSSPGCLSASDVFEFAVGGSGVEGSPDVFRSPSSARQSTVFLFPYTAASAALSVCDPTDSF